MHSNLINPHDKAEVAAVISAPIIRSGPTEPVLASLEKTGPQINIETAKLAKELNLDAGEMFDKFALDQEALHGLIYKIKELHLKRLFSGTSEEFETLTKEIKQETIASGRPEAREWLSTQLDGLTKEAAEYKLKLLKSLDSIGLNSHQEKHRTAD